MVHTYNFQYVVNQRLWAQATVLKCLLAREPFLRFCENLICNSFFNERGKEFNLNNILVSTIA